MILPSYKYRDPLLNLLDEERRTCKGCRFLMLVFDRQVCGLQRRKLRRCGMYAEKGEK
jgi:hypothetical protein